MYVVTGATGHTGSVIAETLLSRGKKVRVIGRNAERLNSLVSLGAEPLVGDISDKETAARAFSGAEAAYIMIPPEMTAPDYSAYQDKVVDAIALAVEKSGTQHLLALSSVGADKPNKTGPIAGLHRMEERLKRVSGLNTLFLRAGYFMENTLAQAGAIRQMGAASGPLRPDLKVSMIAVRDIGPFAADALLRLDFHGYQAQELLGQRDLSMVEATGVIGQAIGKQGLQYHQMPYDQFGGLLQQMGMSPSVAALVTEMAEAMNSGHVRALEPRSTRNTTPTSYEQFVREEFVPAYQATAAGAASA